MGFLLDTNVISELRRRQPSAAVLDWFAGVPSDEVFLSVLTVGELRQGIERLRPRDPDRADSLNVWLAGLHAQFAERIATVDSQIAERWGRLNASRPLPVIDGLLAATALVHGWTLATRNTKDFDGLDLSVVNPFEP
jgi:predicted nucleic acid-binding protein